MDVDDDDLFLYGDEIKKEGIEEVTRSLQTETVSMESFEPTTIKQEVKPELLQNEIVSDISTDSDIDIIMDFSNSTKPTGSLVNLKFSQKPETKEEFKQEPNGQSSGNLQNHNNAKIDLDTIGTYNRRSILDIDPEELAEKPWLKPGADITDYFNYGFNELTWRVYCFKQKEVRDEFQKNKKINVYESGPEFGNSNSRAWFNPMFSMDDQRISNSQHPSFGRPEYRPSMGSYMYGPARGQHMRPPYIRPNQGVMPHMMRSDTSSQRNRSDSRGSPRDKRRDRSRSALRRDKDDRTVRSRNRSRSLDKERDRDRKKPRISRDQDKLEARSEKGIIDRKKETGESSKTEKKSRSENKSSRK